MSDRRLIENVIDTSDGLATLQKLRVQDFNYRGGTQKYTGLIAQDVKEIYPQAVTRVTPAGPLVVDFSLLVPILIRAVQQLTDKVKKLQDKVEDDGR